MDWWVGPEQTRVKMRKKGGMQVQGKGGEEDEGVDMEGKAVLFFLVERPDPLGARLDSEAFVVVVWFYRL
jgi:hypothetical protein